MADRFYIKASATPGNWNDVANWSTTDGGLGGASVPGSADVARFTGGVASALSGRCVVNATVNVLGLVLSAGYTGLDALDAGHFDNIANHPITLGTSGFTADNRKVTWGAVTWDCGGNCDYVDVVTIVNHDLSQIKMTTNGTSIQGKDLTGTLSRLWIAGGTVGSPITLPSTRRVWVNSSTTIDGVLSVAGQFVGEHNTGSAPLGLILNAGARLTGLGNATLTGVGITTYHSTALIDCATLEIFGSTSPLFQLAAGTYGSAVIQTSLRTVRIMGDLIFSNTAGTVLWLGHADPSIFDFSTHNANSEYRGSFNIDPGAGVITWMKGTGKITLTGGAAQNVGLANSQIEDVEINKTAGSVATLTRGGLVDSWTGNSGAIFHNGKIVTSAGVITYNPGFKITEQDQLDGLLDAAGALLLDGEPGNVLRIDNLNVRARATGTADYCVVRNSNASTGNAIDAQRSLDDGGNTNWTFAPLGGGGAGAGGGKILRSSIIEAVAA